MKIRRATIADKDELLRLAIDFENFYQASLSKQQSQIRAYKDIDHAAVESIDTHVSNPDCVIFVADDDGILIGFISGEKKVKKFRNFNVVGYVDGWFVEKVYQSQGIGKKLFDKLTEYFKKVGCTHIELETNIENTKEIHIYEHMGLIKRQVTFFKKF